MMVAIRAIPLALPLSLTFGVLKPASRRYFREMFLHLVRASDAVLVHGWVHDLVHDSDRRLPGHSIKVLSRCCEDDVIDARHRSSTSLPHPECLYPGPIP